MGRRGRVDADGPKFGDRRRRPRPVARPFWIPHFGKLRRTEGRPSAEFDADGCGTPRDTSRMPVGGSLSRFGRCRTELKSGTRRHISRNLTCQYDLEVHDDAGDVVERGWGWVGGVEWMPIGRQTWVPWHPLDPADPSPPSLDHVAGVIVHFQIVLTGQITADVTFGARFQLRTTAPKAGQTSTDWHPRRVPRRPAPVRVEFRPRPALSTSQDSTFRQTATY